MTTPTLLKSAVEALNARLEELTPEASPEQLAYLSKSVQNMAGQGTILDIVALTDDKLQELVDAATAHLADIDNAETSALGAIGTAQTDALDEIATTKVNALADMLSDKDDHIAALDSAKTSHLTAIQTEGAAQLAPLSALASDFELVNDVPDGSSIMGEIGNVQADLESQLQATMALDPNSIPFLFGILSRYQAHNYGQGEWTSQLGQWYTNNEDWPFRLITGAHGESTSYSGFMRPPALHFLEGSNGRFNYKRQFHSYANSSNVYQYPAALIGIFFVKNTTGSNISRTFYFGGSSYWGSGYEGASLNVGVPNEVDANKENITGVSWNTVYSYSSSTHDFGGQSATVEIPAGKTVAIMLYTSAYYFASPSSQYASFMGWYVYNFRSNFMTTGLEIDFERTLKAWQQGVGTSNTHQIWL